MAWKTPKPVQLTDSIRDAIKNVMREIGTYNMLQNFEERFYEDAHGMYFSYDQGRKYESLYHPVATDPSTDITLAIYDIIVDTGGASSVTQYRIVQKEVHRSFQPVWRAERAIQSALEEL